MGDLVKALEADLFGSYEWAADLYDELATVREPADRLLVAQGLFRAHEALGREDDSALAAALLAEAEAAVPPAARDALAGVAAAREALLDATTPREQVATLGPAFLAAFEAAWERGPREPLAADAVLAALVRANLLSGRGHSTPGEPRPDLVLAHRRAADLYAAAAGVFEARARSGEHAWQETARSCWHRAVIAWRAAGDDARARMADEAARGLGAGAGSYR